MAWVRSAPRVAVERACRLQCVRVAAVDVEGVGELLRLIRAVHVVGNVLQVLGGNLAALAVLECDRVSGGGEVEGLLVPQMVKPPNVTETSEENVIVSPTAIATLKGPVVPLYCVPPMVTWSKKVSVEK